MLAVATAIEDHYRPQGPGDRVPTDPVAIAVALADKIDTLVGFWAIDEKPTGSKDPYALRRAALGVIRILIENDIRLRLSPFAREQARDLLAFFADRLKVYLRDKGARHDLIDAAMGALAHPARAAGNPPRRRRVKTTTSSSSSVGSRRSENCSNPKTARIFSPATSAPRTFFAPKKRRMVLARSMRLTRHPVHQRL